MLIVNFSFIMICFRLWGKHGLFIWLAISSIIANIQVTKNISVFGLEATLGNIVYSTNFLATDILAEFYSEKDAERAVYSGLFAIVAMTILMQLAILFTPSVSDTVSDSMTNLFRLMPRITIASVSAYFLSNLHDIKAYLFWKKKTSGKHLWLRNNASTMVSQIIDTVVFTLAAFLFVYPKQTLIQIMLTTYFLKFITAVCDTAIIYVARYWVKGNKIQDLW